jgi:hypothetical protein
VSRRTGRLTTGLLIALVVVVAAVIVTSYVQHSHRGPGAQPPGAPPAGAPAPGALRATLVDGRVTGQASTNCRERSSHGQPLPDPICTPGVISTAVTQADLGSTICRRGGYTSTIRPPESRTAAFKKKIMIAYHVPGSTGDYELDHLVSPELGGSNDAGNLWPERNDHPKGAINSKDLVENALHKAVCEHRTSLTSPQTAIASDWTTALTTLGLPPAG